MAAQPGGREGGPGRAGAGMRRIDPLARRRIPCRGRRQHHAALGPAGERPARGGPRPSPRRRPGRPHARLGGREEDDHWRVDIDDRRAARALRLHRRHRRERVRSDRVPASCSGRSGGPAGATGPHPESQIHGTPAENERASWRSKESVPQPSRGSSLMVLRSVLRLHQGYFGRLLGIMGSRPLLSHRREGVRPRGRSSDGTRVVTATLRSRLHFPSCAQSCAQ